MEIIKDRKGEVYNVAVTGRLDTSTAPMLEEELGPKLEGVTELCLDFTGLDYISSAGLRVLLASQKKMMKQGSMVIRNVSAEIMEIFDITGFSDILTIEN